MDDTDRSITLLLVEDNQNDVESTLAVLSEGRPIEDVFIARDGEEALEYLLRTGAYRAQAAENPKAELPGLNHQPSSAQVREL